MLYALLVGINSYNVPGVAPLTGGVNDIYYISDLLKAAFPDQIGEGSIRLVIDRDASYDKVIQAFDHLRQAGPDDQILFYYSGHGSRVRSAPEFARHNPDAFDETLVLADSRTGPGKWDLHDKELAMLFSELYAQCPHITAWLDCCHSGSMFRSSRRFRTAGESRQARPLDSYYGNWESDDPRVPEVPVTSLTACQKEEQAAEDPFQQRGAFSLALEKVLKERSQLSYAELHTYARVAVMEFNPDQSPRLECQFGSDPHRMLFGTAIQSQEGGFPLRYEAANAHQEAAWYLGLGILQGLPADPEKLGDLEVFEGTALQGKAELKRIGVEKSALNFDFVPEKARQYVARFSKYRPQPYLLGLRGLDAEVAAALATWQTEYYPFVELISDAPELETELRFVDGQWQLWDVLRKRQLFRGNELPWREQIRVWHRYRVLLEGEPTGDGPAQGEVKLRWILGGGAGEVKADGGDFVATWPQAATHIPVRLEMRSQTENTWYWYLFYLDHLPGIHLYTSDTFSGNCDYFTLLSSHFTQDQHRFGQELSVKLLISRHPVDIFDVVPPGQSPAPLNNAGESEVFSLKDWIAPNLDVHFAQDLAWHPGTNPEIPGGLRLEADANSEIKIAWRNSLPYLPSPDKAETPARILRELGGEPMRFHAGNDWHYQVLEIRGGEPGESLVVEVPIASGEECQALVWDGEHCKVNGKALEGTPGHARFEFIFPEDAPVYSRPYHKSAQIHICFFNSNAKNLDLLDRTRPEIAALGL